MIRLLLASALAIAGATTVAQQTPAPLAFRIDEGRNINAFLRQGPVAAHLLLRSGDDPRILVAFPAGDSGTGLWFEKTATPVTWRLDQAPTPYASGKLHGVRAVASVDAAELRFRQAVLSSVRVLRDYEALGKAPAEILAAGKAGTWARDRLDGAPGYALSVAGLRGTTIQGDRVKAGPDGRITLAITAATGETPLTPLAGPALLNGHAGSDARAQNALQFLSYREKYLAGSWRFDTYFGRDTLMSLRLLMPVLQPGAVEAGLGAVLARLAANGEVAHEEDIGEFAVLRNMREGRGRIATPIYDYAMVDDDFMLAPVASAWLLGRGAPTAATFLNSRDATGRAQGDRLVANFAWVVKRTAAFAASPAVDRLIGLKGDRLTGQWRDSEEGLGRGRYPYDVNAVWVPTALDAIAAIDRTGLLKSFGTPAQRATIGKAGAQAAAWHRAAPPLFTVTIPADRAAQAVRDYAGKVGVPAQDALAALGRAPVTFNALSLQADGAAVPVLHSDDGFALLFTDPDAAALDRSLTAMMRPFPAGLMTPVGLLVANPAFAAPDVQARFGASAYHGTVVWSWQQAVLAAGLNRQIARTDLPADIRARAVAARTQLWRAIQSAGEVRTSELWSWAYRDGGYRVAPFGAQSGDADESNAAQLWSTVFLALRPPAS
ncbi:hypothetical protein [Sphingomonas sp.]|uniref:hypothetical protein n=1 Tax=Sphingomonas sp. TaxID=28214 RepID=UPI0035B34FC0